MTITTSLCGVKREYFTEDGVLKAAILRDTKDIKNDVAFNMELQNNVDHAAIMKQNSVLVASIDEADWIMVMEQHGITNIFSDEAVDVAKKVFLQGGDWRYARCVPDKNISHEALKK